jgi:SSS family solute:Na+ symporter
VYDSIIPAMLSGLPEILLGIVVILVLSASMSTLSSLVLTSGSTMVLDIFAPALQRAGRTLNEPAHVFLIRVFVVFFIAVSAAIAIVQAKSAVTFIAQLMGISWGALAGAFLAPFLYGLYWKRATAASVMVNFAVGVGIMCLCMGCRFAGVPFINAFFSSPINAGVLAMAAGLVVVPAVSFLTKTPGEGLVSSMFACYDRRVVVRATNALPDAGEAPSA